MNIGKGIIDQIQDALGEMEDTGFLDELVNNAEKIGERAERPAPKNTSETDQTG